MVSLFIIPNSSLLLALSGRLRAQMGTHMGTHSWRISPKASSPKLFFLVRTQILRPVIPIVILPHRISKELNLPTVIRHRIEDERPPVVLFYVFPIFLPIVVTNEIFMLPPPFSQDPSST